ncbi:uncharacterized protein LOC135961700 [Calliphora vicina]|uniref:uncharacterized protein LOC135961700 n=1 Tax=Calliphora vicina TaxID=7373 RepID=UPI00325B4518
MNSLNTDCLIEIVKFLNLKDQVTLNQVDSSLQLAVTTLWLIKYKHIHINFLEVPLTNQEFWIFLKTIKDAVEVLQLRFLTKDKYEIMKQFCFKRVHNFRFTLSKPYFLEDNDLKDLRKMLPNLKAFSPHGNLSGLYMDEWPLLKDLNLSFCFKLEMQHFHTIINQLKLEKLKLNVFPNNNQFEQMNLLDAQLEYLKYLELNTYEFYYFLAKPLKALKELIITNHYNPRQLFDVLLSIWQAKDIRLVETANVDNILVNSVEMHLNVEQLTIVNDENPLPSNIISSLHLLTDLRKLRFKSCQIKSKNFINLLKNTPQLQDISFEHCQFDVANICVKVEEIITNRSEKLRLNMFENRLMENSERPAWSRGMEEILYVVVDVLGQHNLIELTQFKGTDLCYEPLYVVYR